MNILQIVEQNQKHGFDIAPLLWIGGIAIVLYGGYRLLHKNQKSESNSGQNTIPAQEVPKLHHDPWRDFDKKTSPQECLIKNIKLFAPLLDGIQSGTLKAQEWKEAIITTKNHQLLDYWNKVHDKASSWQTLLQMWGITYDSCQSFIGMEAYKEMYTLQDGTSIELGKKYNVVKPCWVLTQTSTEGVTQKSVISKGIVKLAV